ncbi:mCG1039706 [Mus musculus]|nr:mCG1039706 [Mus musculus]
MNSAADLLGPYVCVERGLSTRVGKAWMMTDRHTRRRVCVESECNFTTEHQTFYAEDNKEVG